MAVVSSADIEDVGTYTPFRGFDREYGPVGTVSVDAEATGDAGGGTVEIVVRMSKVSFGFHPIFVPTRVVTQDSLATAAVVRFQFEAEGNERLRADLAEVALAVASPGTINVASFDELGVTIEPQVDAGDRILAALWATNEDGDTYHLHVFGVLYDGEALARGKRAGKTVDNLLAGVR